MGRAGFSPTARRSHFLVLFALMAEPGLRERPSAALHALGDASYSIYLTHLPVIFGFQWLLAKGYLPFGGGAPGLCRGPRRPRRGPRLPLRLSSGPCTGPLMARLAGRRVGTRRVYAP